MSSGTSAPATSKQDGSTPAKSTAAMAEANKMYSGTLFLPKTSFPLRAGGEAYETKWRELTTEKLYAWQKENLPGPPFVLHDGPPYANGELHMGHALNKVLKDIILRFNVLRGRQVHYIPGWDCHGLPIEAKALAELKKRPADLLPREIRAASRVVAKREIEVQRQGFREFGILADWNEEGTYKTLDHNYEIRQLRLFHSMLSSGLIYRHYRPVYWSPSSRSALAEAELEYNPQHVSRSVYVGMKLFLPNGWREELGLGLEGQEVEALVWTTTPWTLPANMGIAYNPELAYTVLTVLEDNANGAKRHFLVAKQRVAALTELFGGAERASSNGAAVLGRALEGLSYAPLFGQPSTPTASEKIYTLFPAPYVKADTGTGLVHSAPGHGLDDYHTFLAYLSSSSHQSDVPDIFSPVDNDGLFSSQLSSLIPAALAAPLLGKPVLSEGTDAVIRLLSDNGRLMKEVKEVHNYYYDWRTKKPVIVRATKQWFANIENIKPRVESAIDDVDFFPSNGKTRLSTYIRERSEWCISRQRAWGVPIPIIYDALTDEPVLDEEVVRSTLKVLEEKGVDSWWDEKVDVEEFLPPALRGKGQYKRGMDTMDVWFDSGTSWTLLRDSEVGQERVGAASGGAGVTTAGEERKEKQLPAWSDLALEGSDQHRGWFQSLMLTAVSCSGSPGSGGLVKPYHTVITHGFVLDEKGRKMSKSEGNVLSPLMVIRGGKDLKKSPAYGTEVLRMWVATVEFWKDVSVGPTILSHVTESMRKIRNSARFILGNLGDGRGYGPVGSGEGEGAVDMPVRKSELSLADRYIMHTLYNLEATVIQAYATYNFPKVTSTLSNFANITLSSLYFDIIKDSLYADGLDDSRRKGILWVLQNVLYVLTRSVAPIAPYLAEEIHQTALKGSTLEGKSVFTTGWNELDPSWNDPAVEKEMETLLGVRGTVLGLLEKARGDKLIRSSLEAEVDFIVPGDDENGEVARTLSNHEDFLKTLFIVSDASVMDEGSMGVDVPAWVYSEPLEVRGHDTQVVCRVRPASQHKCPRCWTYTREEPKKLCPRCEDVVTSLDA